MLFRSREFSRGNVNSTEKSDKLAGKDLTDAQRNYLSSRGIRYHDGDVLGKLQILLFSQDDNGEIASYFDGKRVSVDWNSQTVVKRDELWICHVTMNTENLGYAKPLQKVSPSDILKMNGKIEQIAEYMWIKKPKDVAKHVDVGDGLDKINELTDKIENLQRDYNAALTELKLKENAGETLRSEIEEEFRQSEAKLVEGHRTELEELREEYDASEKDMIDKYNGALKTLKDELDELTVQNKKLSEEKNNMVNNEEIQKLNIEIRMLQEEKVALQIRINEMNDEIIRKKDEFLSEKRTISDYYESKIESLEMMLKDFEQKLSVSSKTSGHFTDIESVDIEEMQHSLDEKDREIEVLRINISKMSARLEDMQNMKNEADRNVKSSVTVNGENTKTRSMFSMTGSVIRVSADEFKCSLIDEGTYAVKINVDRTVMRFVPDEYGNATCSNGIIRVPDLNLIKVLDGKMGELNWRMVNGNTLEVSI